MFNEIKFGLLDLKKNKELKTFQNHHNNIYNFII
jgi:hypothetical protein